MPAVGDAAPKLSGATGDGETLSLHDLIGPGSRQRWLVVYFYPRDDTPGCTTEAQSFRDLYPEFQARGAEIVGVSRDSVGSHGRFAAKQTLPFPLIADVDESWCRAFGVIQEKVLYGKRHLGIVRSTFLLAPDGRIAGIWQPVKVAGHAEAVLAAIPASA